MIYEADEELMNQLNIMRTLKTIRMTPFVANYSVRGKHCHNCRKWVNGECLILGKIVNPDGDYCSWYKDKNLKIKKVRHYLSLK